MVIRAAVIPYLRRRADPLTGIGTCCLVRTYDPHTGDHAEAEIEVGRLEPGEGRPQRVCGPDEIAAVVSHVVALLVERRVQSVAVEEPAGSGMEAERGRFIADDIGAVAVKHAVVRRVPAAKGDVEARLLALMENEGPDVSAEPSPTREPAGFAGRDHLAAPTAQSMTSVSHSAMRGSEEQSTPVPPAAQAPKAGRRIAGIDPGSKYISCEVIEETGDPVTPGRRIAGLFLTIGRDVPLLKPKVITRKSDGSTYTKTTRHEVTDEDRLEALRAIAAFCAEHEIDEAVVETAKFMHKGGSALLLRAQDIGGEIAGWLRAAGLPMRRVSSAMWRARVKKAAGPVAHGGADGEEGEGKDRDQRNVRRRGLRHGVGQAHLPAGHHAQDHVPEVRGGVHEGHGAPLPVLSESGGSDRHGRLLPERSRVLGDAHAQVDVGTGVAWPSAVRALVSDLPALPPDTREHALDAAGCALWALLPAPETKPPARPVTPRRKGGKASGWSEADAERQRKRREERRRAAGCVCVGGCRAPCPVALAANEKRAQKMMGNANARRSET